MDTEKIKLKIITEIRLTYGFYGANFPRPFFFLFTFSFSEKEKVKFPYEG